MNVRYPVVNVGRPWPRLAQAPATAAPATPAMREAAQELANARKALVKATENQSKLAALIGEEKAAQAVEEANESVRRAEEAYRAAAGG